MRRLAVLTTVVPILLVANWALAKASTSRITVQNAEGTVLVEITDAHLLSQYRVWAGPHTSSNEAQSLIVDWTKPASEPPPGLTRYNVGFYVNDGTMSRLIYSVTYVYDPAAETGYVYIPGKDDPRWQRNVQTIWHGVEGNWFRAWSAWDITVIPMLQPTSRK